MFIVLPAVLIIVSSLGPSIVDCAGTLDGVYTGFKAYTIVRSCVAIVRVLGDPAIRCSERAINYHEFYGNMKGEVIL